MKKIVDLFRETDILKPMTKTIQNSAGTETLARLIAYSFAVDGFTDANILFRDGNEKLLVLSEDPNQREDWRFNASREFLDSMIGSIEFYLGKFKKDSFVKFIIDYSKKSPKLICVNEEFGK